MTSTDIQDTRYDDPLFLTPGNPRWIFFDDAKPSAEERKKREEAIEEECNAATARSYPSWQTKPTRLALVDNVEQFVGPIMGHETKITRKIGGLVRKGGLTEPFMVLKQVPVPKQNGVQPEGFFQDDEGTEYERNPGFVPGKTHWVDPEVERHHDRMAAVSYARWLAGWYRRNSVDQRETLLGNLVSSELSPRSFLTPTRKFLQKEFDIITATKVWEKLSIFKAVRNILTKPEDFHLATATRIHHRKTLAQARVMGHWTVWTAREWISREAGPETPSHHELHEWKTIHTALDGHGNINDFQPRKPSFTIFGNPDGSRFRGKKQGDQSPIQAKQSFAKRHKVDPDRVMVERVHRVADAAGKPCKQDFYYVSARKLSNETPSGYYDESPSKEVIKDRNGEWLEQYRYNGGQLMRVEGPMLPEGAYRLTVRDLERALLQGASFADNDHDAYGSQYESHEHCFDDRERSDDGCARQKWEKLDEVGQAIYLSLRYAEMDDLAELMTRDLAEIDGEYECSPDVISTISGRLMNNDEDREAFFETLALNFSEQSGEAVVLLDLMNTTNQD